MTLPSREGGAVGALAKVRAELAPLRSWQPTVQLARDRKFRFAACQRPFELLAQGAARTKDERLDGARRDVQDLGDLGVRASLELAHDERGALVEPEVAQCAADVLAGGQIVVDDRVRDVVLERDLRRSTGRLPEALPADVVRNRDQPVLRLLRTIPLLDV